MPTTVSYPFDDTGVAPSNKVENELHTLTEVNSAPYRILIPVHAPFYLHNLLLEHVNQEGVVTPMVEGVDYYAALPYMAASRSTGRPVYGGLAMISDLPQGTMRLVQYQTVGGDWTADRNYVYEQLLASQYNSRTTWWDLITNVQELFPPSDHQQPVGDVAGHLDLLAKLDEIRAAILTSSSTANVPVQIFTHMEETGNAHGLTLSDIGLDQIQNLPLATDQEVQERQEVDKYVTLRQIALFTSTAIQPGAANSADLSEVPAGFVVKLNNGELTSRSLSVSGNGLSLINSLGTAGNPKITISAHSENYGSSIVFRDKNGDFSANLIFANLNGIASQANALSNSRFINGVSFDGQNDIITEFWGAERNLTIGNASKIIDGSQDVNWTLSEIGAASSDHTHDFSEITGTSPASSDVGVLGYFRRTTAPAGWLKANGAVVSVAVYSNLAEAIYVGDVDNAIASDGYRCTDPLNPSTSRSTSGEYIVLPDMRSEFVRGWDDGRGIDSGRVLGSYQAQKTNFTQIQVSTGKYGGLGIAAPPDEIGTWTEWYVTGRVDGGNRDIRVSSVGTENRPRNAAWLACIKY